jgi:hypothetical protein
LAELVPPAVVTKTLAVPAVRDGVTQVIEVAEITEGEVQATPMIVTVVAPVTKLVPVIVTLVPPAVGPEVGLIAVTVGAAT